jgi:hypothetical protein
MKENASTPEAQPHVEIRVGTVVTGIKSCERTPLSLFEHRLAVPSTPCLNSVQARRTWK